MGAYWTLSNNPAVPVDYLSLSNLQACSGTPGTSVFVHLSSQALFAAKGSCEVWESVVCPALMSMKSLFSCVRIGLTVEWEMKLINNYSVCLFSTFIDGGGFLPSFLSFFLTHSLSLHKLWDSHVYRSPQTCLGSQRSAASCHTVFVSQKSLVSTEGNNFLCASSIPSTHLCLLNSFWASQRAKDKRPRCPVLLIQTPVSRVRDEGKERAALSF